MTRQIDTLAQITEAAYQADLARLQAIASEEATLRAALQQLATQERDNAASDPINLLAHW